MTLKTPTARSPFRLIDPDQRNALSLFFRYSCSTEFAKCGTEKFHTLWPTQDKSKALEISPVGKKMKISVFLQCVCAPNVLEWMFQS